MAQFQGSAQISATPASRQTSLFATTTTPTTPPPPEEGWGEVTDVEAVERVLTPLFVTLVVLSNATLLAHEGRVAWRCRRVIPPKLLVMVLAATDLAATVLGFLPLWLLSLVGLDTVALKTHSAGLDTSPQGPASAFSDTHTPGFDLSSPGNSSARIDTYPAGSNASVLGTFPHSSTHSPDSHSALPETVSPPFNRRTPGLQLSLLETTSSLSNIRTPSFNSSLPGVAPLLPNAQTPTGINQLEAWSQTSGYILSTLLTSAGNVTEGFLGRSGSDGTPASLHNATEVFPTPAEAQSVASTVGYSVALFLLTALWTLAQGIVVVMGVERMLALTAPFFYTRRCTTPSFMAVLALLALGSCAVAACHVAVHLHEVHVERRVYAGFWVSGSLPLGVVVMVQGVVWTVVLLACNCGVMVELRRMERSVTVVRGKNDADYLQRMSLVHGAGREFARFMMAVNFIFVLASFPHLVSGDSLSLFPSPFSLCLSSSFCPCVCLSQCPCLPVSVVPICLCVYLSIYLCLSPFLSVYLHPSIYLTHAGCLSSELSFRLVSV